MIRRVVLELVIKAKKAFEKKEMNKAWYYWQMIYDELEGNENVHELHKAMELFSNEEVYGITDYGKRINGYA